MRVTTYRGEASVRDLAARLFRDLDDPAVKRAEAALLHANPSLGDLGALRPGAVLNVPNPPGLRPRVPPEEDDPGRIRDRELQTSLQAYASRLERRHDDEAEALTRDLALAESDAVQAAMSTAEGDPELLQDAVAATRDRLDRLRRDRDAHTQTLAALTQRLDRP